MKRTHLQQLWSHTPRLQATHQDSEKKQHRAPLGRFTKWRKVRFASPLVCTIPNELLINSPARPVRRDPSRLTEFWTCVSVFLEVLFETLYGPCLFVINTDGKKCHYRGMGWVKVMKRQEIAQFIPQWWIPTWPWWCLPSPKKRVLVLDIMFFRRYHDPEPTPQFQATRKTAYISRLG